MSAYNYDAPGCPYDGAPLRVYTFTGKERDSESGLDNFGARYYGSGSGRFTSVDPKLTGVPFPKHVHNPQLWNMYGYVANNPLKFVDPNGEDIDIVVSFKGNFTDEETRDNTGTDGTFTIFLTRENQETFRLSPVFPRFSNGTLYWGSGPLLEGDLSGNLQREFVFVNGKRIARRDISGGAQYYYFTDQLGSSDVVTTSAGVIQNESDYYPYGGERVYSQILANQNYKFTGKERDSESGLDNFGARYNASSLGRFMTPDPLLNSGRPWNPQTWNR